MAGSRGSVRRIPEGVGGWRVGDHIRGRGSSGVFHKGMETEKRKNSDREAVM